MPAFLHTGPWDDPKRAKPAPVDAFSNPGVLFQWSVVRRATQSLDVGAPLLRFQTPLLGTSTRPRRSSRRCWRQEGVGHDFGQPNARSFPVAQLRAVLGCRDRQHSVDNATAQTLEESLPLEMRENGGACHIPHEFRPRVGSVHTLPAGTG
jgi:hypothetical protein